MHENGKPEWYYTAAGERFGPVTWVALKTRADDGSLDPRNDFVWRPGVADWLPAGQIEGLFLRVARPAEPESLSSPYEAPLSVPDEEERPLFLEDWPGFGRGKYIATVVLYSIAVSVGTSLVRGMAVDQQLVGLGKLGLSIAVTLYVTFQRFANLGMSRWWVLGNMVPVLNLWTGYRLFACPQGYAMTRKLDGIGKFLAILYWLMVVLSLVAVAALAYLLLHAGANPEFRRFFESTMAKVRAQGHI